VKVTLKGLHRVSRKLANGKQREHFYAWRGGPKIEAKPGTAEFISEFKRLTAERDGAPRYAGTFQQIINEYQRSGAFTELAKTTQADYINRIKMIELRFGDMPLRAVEDPRARGEFLGWRDELAAKGHTRSADLSFAVLARIVSWAHNRRLIGANQCERPGRLHRGTRVASVWNEVELRKLMASAPPQIVLPVMIALWTGQRQGDIIALTWASYDGAALRLRQSKTGATLTIPCAAPLRAALNAARGKRPESANICTTQRGAAWSSHGFRSSFRTAITQAGIEGRTFHDLRGTAVTRLAIAGASVPEIASITGHSLKDVETMLDKHYLSRDRALGESAIAKLEAHGAKGATVNGPVNGPITQTDPK
jgi:integrase